MIIEIAYSIDFEINRVKDTLDRLPWYKEKGYAVSLPERLTGLVRPTPEEVSDSIIWEYDEALYQETKGQVEMRWEEMGVEKRLRNGLSSLWLALPKNISVRLTRYWTKWSYDPPNEIVLNVDQRRPITSVIIHELIHLTVHPHIEVGRVSHWHKEAIVDFIFRRILPELSFGQSIKAEYVKDVKEFFSDKNSHFPNAIIEFVRKMWACSQSDWNIET